MRINKQKALKSSEKYGDLDYINTRNQLIPVAVQHANKKCRKTNYKNNDDFIAEWNKAYHRKMDELNKNGNV